MKPFTEYTLDDLRELVSINIEGFLFITQLAIKQMSIQQNGGSIVNLTAALADHPIAGINASVAMITKGGLNAVTRSLAMEYVRSHTRKCRCSRHCRDTDARRGADGGSRDAAAHAKDR